LKIHPNDRFMEEFVLALSPEYRVLVLHLARCSSCRRRLRRLLTQPPGPVAQRLARILGWSESSTLYDRALASSPPLQARSFGLGKERAEAPGLFVELTSLPAEQRSLLLRNSERFHTWGLFELLVERSLETAIRNAVYAEELGHLALQVSEHLDSGYHGKRLIEDLRARTWAHIGNARRVRFDLQGAEEAFHLAYEHLQKGTKEPLERAIFLDLKASLRRSQRKFDEAFKLLRRAVELFLEIGQQHRAGRSLVKMSTVHHVVGQIEEAIPLLYRALELIDPEQEPRLLLCARHNLIDDLADSGRFLEAQGVYRETRTMYRDFPERWVQNRRKWVRGKIARGQGQAHHAEVLFLAARDGFIAEGVPYDTALISLEIATLYAEQGRLAELKRLAEEMLPIFTSRQIPREALAALSFFQQAVEAEEVNLQVVSSVADFLRRAQHDPEQRFRPPV
jgi:tetratricopeptide (TPR) repeat protein